MTIKEYIAGLLKPFQAQESDIDFLIASQGLTGTDTLDDTNKKAVRLAIYEQIPLLIAGVQTKVSEGGYTVEYSLDALYRWYNLLAKELGKPDLLNSKPKIKNLSSRW